MAPLATAFVRLRTDSSVLAADASRDAARAGEAAGAAMGTRMSSSLSRTFKAAAGLGAATGLVEAGRKVLGLADQFEGARARVEQNTENIGASFTAVQKPLGDLDSKMAAFGFTVTDTENAFSQLVTATRDPTKALTDVGLAADIARGRHVGLDQATQILMRVETGHVAMLGRLGIATHDANGHLFTQQQALDAITKAYHGNAAAFAATSPGKQAAALAEISKSGAQIGVALLPAFVDLANVMAHDVLPPIAHAAEFFDRNRRTIEPLIKVVLGLTLAWKGYALAVKAAEAARGVFGAGVAVGATAPAIGAEVASLGKPVPVFVTNWVAGAAASLGGAAASGAAGGAAGLEGAGAAIGAGMAANIGRGAGMLGTVLASLKFLPVSAVGGISDVRQGSIPKPLGDALESLNGAQRNAAFASMKQFGVSFSATRGLVGSQKQLEAWVRSWYPVPKAINAATTAEAGFASTTQRTAAQIASHAQKTINFKSAQDAVRQAMHDAAQTAADSGRALTGNSNAALANRNALVSQASAVLNVISVMAQNGSSAASQASMLDVLTRAVEANATKIYGDKAAVDALLRSLGLLPDSVANAAAALATLPDITQAAFGGDNVSPGAIHQLNQAVGKAKDNGTKVAKSFSDGYSPIVSKAATSATNKAAEAFSKLKDRMTSDLQSIRNAIDSTRSSVAGFADFAAQGTDTLGAGGTNTDVAGQLKVKASRLEQFARLFNQLDRANLDAHLMAQFAQIGPDAIPAMQALLHSGRRGIGQVNRIEQRIQTAAGSVATISAAEQNSRLIHDDLVKLPDKLERPFKRALQGLHIPLDIRAVDRKNGIAVVISP